MSKKKTGPDHPTPPERTNKPKLDKRRKLAGIADAIVTLVRKGHTDTAFIALGGLDPIEAAFVATTVYQRLWPGNGFRASWLQDLARAANV